MINLCSSASFDSNTALADARNRAIAAPTQAQVRLAQPPAKHATLATTPIAAAPVKPKGLLCDDQQNDAGNYSVGQNVTVAVMVAMKGKSSQDISIIVADYVGNFPHRKFNSTTFYKLFGLAADAMKGIIDGLQEPIDLSSMPSSRSDDLTRSYENEVCGPFLSSQIILSTIAEMKGKDVLEIGPGNAHGAIQRLAAGIQSVTTVEINSDCIQFHPIVLAVYNQALSQHGLPTIASSRFRSIHADATKSGPWLSSMGKYFDFILIPRVIHYNTPDNGMNLLRNMRTLANPNTTLIFTANVPVSSLQHATHEAAVNNGSLFPGYMVQNIVPGSNGSGVRVLNAFPLKNTDNLEPSCVFLGTYDPKKRSFPHANNLGPLNLSTPNHRAFFLMDIPTAKRMLKATGWEFVSAKYIIETTTDQYAYDSFPQHHRHSAKANTFQSASLLVTAKPQRTIQRKVTTAALGTRAAG